MRCGAPVAPLRAEPSDAAEQVTQALVGERLDVEARRAGWALVVTAYGYRGWVRVDALAPEEGRCEQPSRAASSPLEAARTFLGAPYEWGGMTRAGIDCSGLVHMAYRLSGRLVPRDAWQQHEAATPVASPRAGDLAFYADPGRRVDHVAFWTEDGAILHATGRGGLGVVEEAEPAALRARRRSSGRL